jgi:zinc D-Ala-D-Ala carboxypeptidase
MKLRQAILDYWRFIGLACLATLIVIWTGLTVRAIFTPQPNPQTNAQLNQVIPRPLPNPSSALPSWAKTAPSLAPHPPTKPPTLAPNPVLPAPSLKSPALPPTANPTATPNPSVQRRQVAPQTAAQPTILPTKISRNPLPQARHGHLPYAEASPEQLVSIGTHGTGTVQREERLDHTAAEAFGKMVAAAKGGGIRLIPIPGFRTLAAQEKLFERQIQRQGSSAAAAQLSAPPGYSEHHTGYAVDIGDGDRPTTDLKFEFEQTSAYQWLTANAQRHGFELSFPKDNAQGVSFEPWHWRYVGTGRAAAVFAVARTLQGRS